MTSTAGQILSHATGGSGSHRASGILGGLGGATAQGPLADASRKLVAQSFFGTLLKQMREDPFKSSMLDGGRGGESFNALLDQHLSEKLGRGAGNKLINAFVRRYEKLMPNRKSKITNRKSTIANRKLL